MRRAERLFRLVAELRARSISRAGDLATGLEVSTRTVYRDIAHLQASGLPIEGEAGVGYLLRPGFDLPPLAFTHDQIDALAVGLSFVERSGDAGLVAAAREARAKIEASLPRPDARTLTDAPYFTLRPATAGQPHAGLLRKAIRNRLVAALTYADGNGQRSARHVRPLALWNLPEGWMFSGWCELRQGFRTFRLDRITDLALTTDRFADDPATSLRAFLAQDGCEAQAPLPPTPAPHRA